MIPDQRCASTGYSVETSPGVNANYIYIETFARQACFRTKSWDPRLHSLSIYHRSGWV